MVRIDRVDLVRILLLPLLMPLALLPIFSGFALALRLPRVSPLSSPAFLFSPL